MNRRAPLNLALYRRHSEKLCQRDRAILLWASEGWTMAKIAASENIAVGTVKSRLNRARAALAKHVAAEGGASS